jgi:uncharacterized protein YqeY
MNITELKKEKLLARKERNSVKVDAINYVISTVETIELRNNKQLSDDEVIGTIKKVVSELTETRDMYISAQKHDDAKEAEDQMEILMEYLPQILDEESTKEAVICVIAEVGADSMRDMGKVMGAVKKKLGASVDNALVSKIVKEQLSG